MVLQTLTGALSATALNNNFNDKIATITTQAQAGAVDWQVDVQSALDSNDDANTRRIDFYVSDDTELRVLGLTVEGPNTGSATVTCTLTAVNSDGIDATDDTALLLNQTVQVSVVATSTSEFNATRKNYTSTTGVKLFLLKDITYRLTLESNSANAVNSAHGFAILRSRRRRQ